MESTRLSFFVRDELRVQYVGINGSFGLPEVCPCGKPVSVRLYPTLM